MQGVRDDVLALGVRVLGRGEAPALFAEVPVHRADGNVVFEAFELARNDRAVGLERKRERAALVSQGGKQLIACNDTTSFAS